MGNHNSQLVQFYTGLLTSVYLDQVSAIIPQSEIKRDSLEIENRANCEGLSFLTKTLPRLGKAIDFALANGSHLTISGFKKKSGTQLPAFAWTLFKLVFRSDGLPWFATEGSDSQPVPLGTGLRVEDHDDPVSSNTYRDCREAGTRPSRETEVMALKALRQVCYCFYKLNLPYHHEQEAKILADFVETDDALPNIRENITDVDSGILRTARGLISRVLANSDPLSGRPRHGPGAVATGEDSPGKHTFKRHYRRLAAVFGYDEWFFLNASHLCDSLQELQALETLEAGTAKVVLVPKDSRGPRLISCEPLEYQWVQQALLSVLVPTIEQHPLTRGHVNFTDQTVNRRLALEGSSTFKWVTLDMKEASDRVSLELVKELFPERWFEALYASRSPQTRLPNGRLVNMKKFAPMGSAVCFPVEALVFWALAVATLINTRGQSLREATANVYVYGDDIICRSVDHVSIMAIYPRFGLKLNDGKCCTAGPFKESCGMDAYYGHPVTPVKVHCVWSHRRKPSALASYVAYSNALYEDKCYAAANYIEERIQNIWNKQIPVFSDGPSSGVGFVRKDRDVRRSNRPKNLRYNPHLQRTEVYGFTLIPKSEVTLDTGWNLATRLLTELEAKQDRISVRRTKSQVTVQLNCSSPKRLPTGHYAIAHREQLKRAWTPINY